MFILAMLPFHAVISQAAGGEPLGVSSITSFLPRNLSVILKLLNDVSHTAGTNCAHAHTHTMLSFRVK